MVRPLLTLAVMATLAAATHAQAAGKVVIATADFARECRAAGTHLVNQQAIALAIQRDTVPRPNPASQDVTLRLDTDVAYKVTSSSSLIITNVIQSVATGRAFLVIRPQTQDAAVFGPTFMGSLTPQNCEALTSFTTLDDSIKQLLPAGFLPQYRPATSIMMPKVFADINVDEQPPEAVVQLPENPPVPATRPTPVHRVGRATEGASTICTQELQNYHASNRAAGLTSKVYSIGVVLDYGRASTHQQLAVALLNEFTKQPLIHTDGSPLWVYETGVAVTRSEAEYNTLMSGAANNDGVFAFVKRPDGTAEGKIFLNLRTCIIINDPHVKAAQLPPGLL